MKKISTVMGMVLLITSSAYAEMPVIDYSVLMKMGEQYKVLSDQLKYLTNQYKLIDEQMKFMKRSHEFGSYLNSDAQQQAEQWMPKSVEAYVDQTNSGDFTDEYLKYRYQYYSKLFPHDSSAIDPNHSDSQLRTQYHYSAEWNNYARIAFAKKFDESQIAVKRINDLLNNIDQLDDPKKSADFQIRMMGELAKFSQQQTDLQALQLHLMTIQLEETKIAKDQHANFWKYTHN